MKNDKLIIKRLIHFLKSIIKVKFLNIKKYLVVLY